MKTKKLLSAFLAAAMILANIPMSMAETAELTMSEPTLNTTKYDLNSDGTKDSVYEISNAAELYWFANYVNFTNLNAYGVLTNDIDLNNQTWYPIGVYQDPAEPNSSSRTARYNGYFDGQGHTVSNFTASGNGSQALFGYCSETARIRNVGVKNATVSGWNAAAVVAFCGNADNCYAVDCNITVSTTNSDATDVYGGAVGGYTCRSMKNCYAYNCTLNLGSIPNEQSNKYIVIVGGGTNNNVADCYYHNVTSNIAFTKANYFTSMTAEQFTSGELAYKLQSSQYTNGNWGQELGTDSTPVMDGKKVHKVTFKTSEGDYAIRYVNNGKTVTLPENPIKNELIFDSWRIGESTDSAKFTSETVVTADTVVYAFGKDFPESEKSDVINVNQFDSININMLDFIDEASKDKVTFSLKNGPLNNGLTLENNTLSGIIEKSGTNKIVFDITFDGGIMPMGLNNAGTEFTITINAVKLFDGDGTEASPYTITSIDELKTLRDVANGGYSFDGKFIKLTNDIDLGGSENPWTPIGNIQWDYEAANYTGGFGGTFDGSNHTISCLYVVSTYDSTLLGLFKRLKENGVIKNLSVNGNVTSPSFGDLGILVGQNFGSIINCRISGTVKKDSMLAGGIAGVNFGTITDCRFSGIVDNTNSGHSGGIAGENFGTITRCGTSGTVMGSIYIGGIVGYNFGNITDCYNISDVYSDYYNTGGIVGYNYGMVANCYNTGNITGVYCIGGIVGENNDNSSVKGCYNSGKINGKTKVGAVLGSISTKNEITSDMIPADCYYLDTCITENNEYGTALTAAQMKEPTSFNGWDFNKKWAIGHLSPYFKEMKEEHSANAPDEVITSLDDLKKFRDNVNNGNTYSGKYIVLTADLNLGGSKNPWTPIGNLQWDQEAYGYTGGFGGTFDGVNHTISGIYINNSDSKYQGLFRLLEENGAIKNLNVSGDVTAQLYMGLLAGLNEGTITYCNASGKVSGYTGIGILVGNNYGDIANCTSSGKASGYGCIGGIAGRNYNNITNCHNTGDITGENTIGGIVGENYNDDNYGKDTEITNCYNTGNITGENTIGGIVGISQNWNDHNVKMSISNCYNTGNISGSLFEVGGIAGCILATNVDDCYNIGNITGDDTIGGIVGDVANLDDIKYISPNNCYYLDTCITDGNEHGEALTAEEMKDSENYYDWDFDSVWSMGIERPILNANTEIQHFELNTVSTAETKATVDIFVPAAGTYTVIFADYENGILNTLDPVTITATANSLGKRTVTSNLDITLGKDDKVMFWNSLSEMTPLVEALIVN